GCVVTAADDTYDDDQKLPLPAVTEATIVEHGIVTGATYRAEMPYRGPGEPVAVPKDKLGSPDYLACAAFIDSIRKDQRPQADEQTGWASGVAVVLGNLAIDQGKRIVFSEHLRAKAEG